MVLARVLIDVAPDLLQAIYSQAFAWISGVSSVGGAYTTGVGDAVSTIVDNTAGSISGMFAVIALLCVTSIVILAIKACGMLIVVMAFGRMFELYVYAAVSPLPLAFAPLSGESSIASRVTVSFFKGFAAVCLQGLIMIICMIVFSKIMSGVINETAMSVIERGMTGTEAVMELLFSMLLGTIVMVMSVFKSGSWAKQILGAA